MHCHLFVSLTLDLACLGTVLHRYWMLQGTHISQASDSEIPQRCSEDVEPREQAVRARRRACLQGGGETGAHTENTAPIVHRPHVALVLRQHVPEPLPRLLEQGY